MLTTWWLHIGIDGIMCRNPREKRHIAWTKKRATRNKSKTCNLRKICEVTLVSNSVRRESCDRVPSYKAIWQCTCLRVPACECAHAQNSLATFAHADTPHSAYRRMQTNHSTDAFSMTDWTFEHYKNYVVFFFFFRECVLTWREKLLAWTIFLHCGHCFFE